MTQFICMFLTSFISLMLYRKFFYKRKKDDLIHFISYYALCVIVNNLIMNGVLVLIFKENITTYNYIYFEKYLFISLIIAITLPLIFNNLKDLCFNHIFSYYELIEELGYSLIKKIKECIKWLLGLDITKRIIKYLKSYWKDILKSLFFILFVILQFLLFDKFIREIVYEQISFYAVNSDTPNILSMAYGFIFGVVILFTSKKVGKVLIPVTFIFNLLLFIVNYMLLTIKFEAFSVYNLQIVSEGISYLNYVMAQININFIIIILFSLGLFLLSYKLYKKIDLGLSIDKKVLIITFSAILFIIVRFNALDRLPNYESDNGWKDLIYPKYYAENLINSRKNISVLGLYEYTAKDILNYINSEITTYGSISDIFSKNHKNVCIFKDYTWYDGGLSTFKSNEEIYDYVVDRLEFSKMLISNNYYKK